MKASPEPAMQGLDVARLKALAMEVWRRGGDDTLVKVMAFGARPQPALKIRYCSTIKYVLGRRPAEMERILGFAPGSKLSGGAEVFFVSPLPTIEEFDLRGYSHLPEGRSVGDDYRPHPAYPPGLGAPQWELSVSQAQLHHLATVGPNETFRYRVASLPTPY